MVSPAVTPQPQGQKPIPPRRFGGAATGLSAPSSCSRVSARGRPLASSLTAYASHLPVNVAPDKLTRLSSWSLHSRSRRGVLGGLHFQEREP